MPVRQGQAHGDGGVKRWGDLWCPDLESDYSKYVARADALVPSVQRAKKFRVAVQAGGHIGVVPRLLSRLFRTLYTFEPERENFACLCRNTEDLPHVYAARGVLGNAHGTVGLGINSKSTGGHNVQGKGHVPTYRIDDLALKHCDLIQLDVEGYEVPALWGAVNTIAEHLPLVIVEENKKIRGKGFDFGDAAKILVPFGYRQVDAVGEDLVFAA
jgi:FkbM family methyltransferase